MLFQDFTQFGSLMFNPEKINAVKYIETRWDDKTLEWFELIIDGNKFTVGMVTDDLEPNEETFFQLKNWLIKNGFECKLK